MQETKLYIANTQALADEIVFGKLLKTVSKERQRKIEALVLEKDKRLSLAAGLLMQKAFLDVGIEQYEIEYGKNGKPYMRAEQNICFNLSHSEEVVFCALSCKEVGCDVQKMKAFAPALAKRFFHPAEYKAIMAEKNETARQNLFFRLWTLKESFVKAMGLGMQLPFDSFRIDIIGDAVHLHQNVNQDKYYFKEYALSDSYKAAVCSLNDNFAEIQFVSIL